MAFCTSCGQQVPDGSKFCVGCGKPIAGASTSAPSGAAPSGAAYSGAAPSNAAPSAGGFGPGPWNPNTGYGSYSGQSQSYQGQSQAGPWNPNTGYSQQAADQWGGQYQPQPQSTGKVPVGASIAIIAGAALLAAGLAVGGYFLVRNIVDKKNNSAVEEVEPTETEEGEEGGSLLSGLFGGSQTDTEDPGATTQTEAPTPVPTAAATVSIAERNQLVENKRNEYQNKMESLQYLQLGVDGGGNVSPLGRDICSYAYTDYLSDGSEVGYAICLEDNGTGSAQQYYLNAWYADEQGQLNEYKEPFINAGMGANFGEAFEYSFYKAGDMILAETRQGSYLHNRATTYSLEGYSFDPQRGLQSEISLIDSALAPAYDINSAASQMDGVGLLYSGSWLRRTGIYGMPKDELLDSMFAVVGFMDQYGNSVQLREVGDARTQHVIADSSYRYLEPEDLYGMDGWDLRCARNEIYARHGRLFNTEEVKDFFEEMYWYEGYRSEIPESDFNEYEKANIKLIKSYE